MTTARHLSRRAPRKTRGFAWARIAGEAVVTYRLTRGDMRGQLHMEQRQFPVTCQRAVIARVVNAARHRLRDTVDDVCLRQLGVLEGAAA